MTPPVGIFLRERQPNSNNRESVQQLLDEIIGKNTQLDHHPSGAPFLPEYPQLTLSISHSASTLAVALFPLEKARLGVDVEEKADQAKKLLERYSQPTERELLEKHHLKPLHLWCAKEAAYKAYSDVVTHFTNELSLVNVQNEVLTLQVKKTVEVAVYYHLLPNNTLLAYTAPTPLSCRWV